ncbi:aminoglycoside 3'-phosphotransferase [Eubacteriales bacterium OttesenSCG-928-G02]|nr:aminoglycoside 3'-phosphotransferase [Eubacteriales bacterium OttesenSCG-928-G02]
MQHKSIKIDISEFPKEIRQFISPSELFDKSSSKDAKILFSNKEHGYYIKYAAKGALASEVEMTRYFHKKSLASEVIEYISEEKDWMVTKKLLGEDCISQKYLEQPERLCEKLAENLALLHTIDYKDCPFYNRTDLYIKKAINNYSNKMYDKTLFPDNWGYDSAEEAYKTIKNESKFLQKDTLIHGDYCLPNIILNNWNLSGFIDLDNAGVADRHIDLFWAGWSLCFNLKTDKYRERFFDCYGRNKINQDVFRVVAACEVFG